MQNKFIAALAGACTFAAGCFSLEVPAVQPDDGTAYTREEVLKDPALIELVVAGVFINFWGGQTQDEPWIVLSAFGEEFTSSVTNAGGQFFQLVQEDEVTHQRLQFDNSLTGNTNFARDGWSNYYEANAAATEMPRLIKANNIKIIDKNTGQDNTARLLAFAEWIQGMSHVNLGLLFDSAAIINTTVDLSDVPDIGLSGYQEVLDSGIKWLEHVIEVATANTFLMPLNDDLWVYNTAFTNEEMVRVAHSFIARALAYGPRTPAERAAVDWARVKQHALLGVGTPFGPRGFPNPLNTLAYRIYATAAPENTTAVCNGFCASANNQTQAGTMRVDYRLVGPADTSGNYQAWLTSASGPNFKNTQPFDIHTPDARIQAPLGTTPVFKPVYFKHTNIHPPAMDTVLRGKYYVSKYWNSTRASDNRTQFPRDGGGRNRRNVNDLGAIQDAMVYPVEMDMLIAEAEFRIGNLGAAVTLINKSREGNGNLPPVTTAGVPAGTGCVPRRYDGSCGSLWDALVYEKRIETYASGISFFDLRGWGCLIEGTLTQLPPPGRQLDLQNKPIYTFGGNPGAPGSAPKPTDCPLLHRP